MRHPQAPETFVENANVRSTLYLEPELQHALRFKAATTRRSMSEIVNNAIREFLREDQEDLGMVHDRMLEKTVAYEAFLNGLKADGTL